MLRESWKSKDDLFSSVHNERSFSSDVDLGEGKLGELSSLLGSWWSLNSLKSAGI